MAVSVVGQGDQAATLTTEHSLVSTTAAGVYVLEVDASALQSSETLELRLKTKVRSTGSGATARTRAYQTFTGAQSDPTHLAVGPVEADLYCEATLEQTGGTGRTFPWKLRRIG